MDRSTHKGDISGLFACGSMSHLVSTSMDGSIHVYKLGSMAVTNSLDDDMSAVTIEMAVETSFPWTNSSKASVTIRTLRWPRTISLWRSSRSSRFGWSLFVRVEQGNRLCVDVFQHAVHRGQQRRQLHPRIDRAPVLILDLQHLHPRAAAASSPRVHRPFRLCEWRCAHQRSSAASLSLLGRHHRDGFQRLHGQCVQYR